MSKIVARIIRNQRVESSHRGHIAVVNASGKLIAHLGDSSFQTYMRSAAKPFQIMPMLEDGVHHHFGLTGSEVALIMASHNGESVHIEAVQNILDKIGLTNGHLRCGFHPPMSQSAAALHLQMKAPESAIYNNCSGKHSGMLACAKFNNWPLQSYLNLDHPVQLRIKQIIAAFAAMEEEEIGVGVDGCSAPAFYLPLKNMALMYAKLSQGMTEIAEDVFDTMTAHPEMIAGTRRFDTDVMRAMEGKVASKVGAEGIRCFGVRGEEPIGIALKVEDGSKRATQAVMLEVLKQLDLISATELERLFKYASPVLKNCAGIETGSIVTDFRLSRHS